jgi:1-acyl-sn-glycerol-3-phosphate acyltransferase
MSERLSPAPSGNLLSPTLREVADKVVAWLTRIVARGWFRRIEAEGLERISPRHPVLVVANHPNGFVDPLLLLATSPKPLRMLAKSTLWKVPGLKFVLAFAGVLPVHRPKDRDGTDNRRMFEASELELGIDGGIAIFPEGTVNDALRLKPLKTGAARIALGARQRGATGLRIVPVGLLYSAKTRPRSSVLVRAGEPIELDQAIEFLVPPGEVAGPENHEAVTRLTALIAARLSEAATDYDRGAELSALALAAAVFLRPPDADPNRVQPLSELEPTLRRLAALPDEERAAIVAEAEQYRSNLEVVHLLDADIVPGNTPARVLHRIRLNSGKGLVLAPFGVVGAVVNGPSFVIVRAATAYRAKRPVDVANFMILASIVTFPTTWLVWGFVGRHVGLRHPFRVAFLAGPITGQAAVVSWERLRAVRSARLQWRRTVRDSDLLADLRSERSALVEIVAKGLAGSPRH